MITQQEIKQKIWIGTDEGATLYDFVTDLAKTYTENDGLAGDNIQTIAIDGKDVWLGTDTGLSRYDTEADKWLTFRKASTIAQSSSSANLVSPNIKSLAVDRNYLWVGTRIGLSRYDMLSNTWEQFMMPDTIPSADDRLLPPLAGFVPEALPTKTPLIRAMIVNGKHLWLGTEQGFLIYDSSKKGLEGFLSHVDNIDLNNIRDIIVSKNRICIISDKVVGIYERFSHSNSWTFITDNGILEKSFFFSAEGKVKSSESWTDFKEGIGLLNLLAADIRGDLLWYGRNKGLGIYNIKKKKLDDTVIIPDELSEKVITAIAFDKRWAWVGTRDGLYRYDFDARSWDSFTTEDRLASNRISTLAVENNYVWVGSSDQDVSYYDRSTQKWYIFNTENGLEDNNVRAIVADGKYVWFGTFSGGVCRYDKTSDLWTAYRTPD